MPWNSFESTLPIVLNIVGGFLAGIALILIQTGWKFIDRRLNRRVAVSDLRGCVTKCNQVGLSLLSIRWTIAI